MRIYIVNTDINKILNKMKTLNAFKETNNYIQLYSDDGIFRINQNDNTIKKHIYVDNITKNIKLDNIKIIIDKSEIKYLNDISQIPYCYHKKNIKEENYKLSKRSKLTLTVVYIDNFDSVFDFYFSFDDVVNINSITDDNIIFKEDLLTFLS